MAIAWLSQWLSRCKKKITIKYADIYNTGDLSDAIVDNFIKKIREENSSLLKKENYRHPLSECTRQTLKSSNSQENKNVADEMEYKDVPLIW